MQRHNGYQTVPFSRMRRMQAEGVRAVVTRGAVHGLIEADVTLARRLIRDHQARSGERLSFTAFAIACLARAIGETPHVHAYRDWRNRLVLFDDVDVNTIAEGEADGEKVVLAFFVRGANHKTVRQIHDEIRSFQDPTRARTQLKFMRLFMTLPALVRSLFYAAVARGPHIRKKSFGTVCLTAVGMFGGATLGAAGGWGIPISHHTLTVTLGGIAPRQVWIDGRVEERELLSITLSVDHTIVDGAPAARFAARFKELLQAAHGLREALPASHCE